MTCLNAFIFSLAISATVLCKVYRELHSSCMKPRWLFKWRRTLFVLADPAYGGECFPELRAWSGFCLLWSFPPVSVCFFLLCLAATVVQHCGCCFICCGLRLWWFLSVLVTFRYGTKHLKTWRLKAATMCYFSQLCWLTRQFCCSHLGLFTWLQSAGDSFAMAETAGVLWSLFPCGLILAIFMAWWSQGSRGQEASRPLMAEAGKSHSSISAAFHYSKQVRRPLQSQEVAKSHCNWHIVIEGVIHIFPLFGQTLWFIFWFMFLHPVFVWWLRKEQFYTVPFWRSQLFLVLMVININIPYL